MFGWWLAFGLDGSKSFFFSYALGLFSNRQIANGVLNSVARGQRFFACRGPRGGRARFSGNYGIRGVYARGGHLFSRLAEGEEPFGSCCSWRALLVVNGARFPFPLLFTWTVRCVRVVELLSLIAVLRGGCYSGR